MHVKLYLKSYETPFVNVLAKRKSFEHKKISVSGLQRKEEKKKEKKFE